MKIHRELRSWLEDRGRQQATIEQVAAVRRAFRTHPLAQTLDRRLAPLSLAEPDAILQIAREILDRPDWAVSAFSLLVEAAWADPFFRPAARNASTEILNGLWLYESPLLSLFAAVVSVEALAAKRVFRRGRASVAFTGQRSVYRFVSAGGAILSLWEAPEIKEGFTAEGSGRCRRTASLTLADGDILELDGRRQGFVIDHAANDICYLQAATAAGAAPLMVEYDADRREFAGASSSDEASSRTQMMLSLLRTMDRTDAVPVFEQMLESPHFYARWQTMREFLALDPERALPHLRRMSVSDRHPDVRAAACATIAMLPADSACPEAGMCPA